MTHIPWTVIFENSQGKAEAEVCFGSINHDEMLTDAKSKASNRKGSWSVVGIIKGNFVGGFYGGR